MAPTRYAPLPNPRSHRDPQRELEEAFGSDHEEEDFDDHTESTPLVNAHSQSPTDPLSSYPALSVAIPGAYDFERDYDYDRPPPGSPPGPSSVARPNDYGNSNGLLPSSPIPPVAFGQGGNGTGRPSFFRRAVGALLPQHYARVPTESTHSRAVGGGVENDGVFANVMAKPARAVEVRTEDGDVHMVPEEVQKDMPPSYSEAQADAVPQYWETTVHASVNLDPNADMIVDDLPTGSLTLFAANLFVSYFFNFIGFILTYLLHTSHAAKFGSRAGLGITLIQYGFYSRNKQPVDENGDGEVMRYLEFNHTTGLPEIVETKEPAFASPLFNQGNGTNVDTTLPETYDLTSKDWLAFLLMTLGWFLLLSSFIGFYRVKRWEMSIRASSNAVPLTAEERQREEATRRNIERAFFIPSFEEDEEENNENDERTVETTPYVNEAEERLTRDLRAAGLI